MLTTDAATAATYEKGQLYQLPLADLLADPRQARKVIEAQALEELTASVSKVGVIQPIVFRVDPSGSSPMVVAGERRVAAARQAGLTEIPAIFIDGNYSEIALVENLGKNEGLRPFFRPFGKWGAVPVFSPSKRPRAFSPS